MNTQPISIAQKLELFTDFWKPRVIAEMNDYQFKLVKLKGDFVWHQHLETDEAFIVINGTLQIEFRDCAVTLNAGEMFVVPRGVEHKPYAEAEVHVMLVEPRDVSNTGGEESALSAENDLWI